MVSVLERMTALDPVLFAVDHRGTTTRVPFRMTSSDVNSDPGGARQLPGLLQHVKPDLVLIDDERCEYADQLEAVTAYGEALTVVSFPVDWPTMAPEVP